jgi:hypothetical protein
VRIGGPVRGEKRLGMSGDLGPVARQLRDRLPDLSEDAFRHGDVAAHPHSGRGDRTVQLRNVYPAVRDA